MSEAGTVTVTKHGHVAIVEFDRPPNNHANAGLLTRIADVFETLDADKEVRATVLEESAAADEVVAEFRSEVLDQVLRERIRAETADVRNLVLALAFSKTGLTEADV